MRAARGRIIQTMALSAVSAGAVRTAAKLVLRDGVPAGRGSTRFCLVVDAAHLPPKYVLGLAARTVLGRELRPDEFSGGPQTNSILASLGFSVVACGCGGTARSAPPSGAARKGAPVPTAPPVRPVAMPATSPTIARIISRGRTPDDPRAVERMLFDAFTVGWPSGVAAKFVLTPGGFVRATLPGTWQGSTGWQSRGSDLEVLTAHAAKYLRTVVTDRVLRAATGKVDVLTIGIDLHYEAELTHAELVAVYDVARRRIVRWTGKSYPTGKQEQTLVHVVDLDTHLLEIAGERVLVLGCHDLNMFSPRGHANQSPGGLRRQRCDDMRRKVARFRPTTVLQHPHSTDTPNIWRMPWLSLAREVPSIRAWGSGIAYYSWRENNRADLDRVLDLTKSDPHDVADIVLNAADYG